MFKTTKTQHNIKDEPEESRNEAHGLLKQQPGHDHELLVNNGRHKQNDI